MKVEWKSIMNLLIKGEIVPVIGNDLSLVKNSKPIPLYRYIAGEIAQRNVGKGPFNNLSIHELTLNPHASKIDDIHKEIKFVYDEIKEKPGFYTDPLTALAKITDFKFYISTAIDDLLEKTIQIERKCAEDELEIIDYSLQEKSAKLVNPKITVFKLMGSLYDLEYNAIDEEKMLEYLLSISSRKYYNHPQIKEFLKAVHNKNFLFIGCDFSDWFMRFFIRILTDRELTFRKVKDYVINKSKSTPKKFKNFLVHCGKEVVTIDNTRTDNTIAFVDELYEKWLARKEQIKKIQYEGTVFISYCHKNLKDAKDLQILLEAEAIDVWLDKEEGQQAELHKKMIKKAIRNCQVFVTLISEALLQSPDSYVKKIEWPMAQHALEYQAADDKPFIIIPCFIGGINKKDSRIPSFIKEFIIFDLKRDKSKIVTLIKRKLKAINME